MNFTRRIACGAMAFIMALSVTGCGNKADTSYIATVDGQPLPAGIYLYNLLTAYKNAESKIADSSKDTLKEQVEGVAGAEWIETKAKEATNLLITTEKLFKQLGLAFTAAEEETMEQEVTSLLEIYPDLAAGFDANGISKDSYKRVVASNYMQAKIFPAYYDSEKGVEPIAKSVVQEKFNQDYRRAYIMEFAFFDSETQKDVTEEQKKNLQTLTDDYVTRINDKKELTAVHKDYQTRKGTPVEEIPEEPKVSMLNVPNTTLPQDFFTALDKAAVGEAFKIENEDGIFVAVKYDLNENPEDFTNIYTNVLYDLKGEEFSDKLEQMSKELGDSVVYNDAALALYKANKVKK